MATCPECDAEIEVDEFDVDKGDLISCPDCGSNLEVTSTSPLELEPADDDDDDDDDEEEKEDEDDFDGDELRRRRGGVRGRGLGRVTHAQAGTDKATAAGSSSSTRIAGAARFQAEQTVRAAG